MSEPRKDEDPVLEGEIVDEPTPATPQPVPTGDYTEAGVPTFDYVRDKIEGRFGTSLGATELADTESVDEQMAERERAGRDRLEQIRKSLRGE